MTDKLYLEDTYLFESSANIISRGQDDRGHYILLDSTIFYPQGGGQPCDHGIVRSSGLDIKISDVRQVDDEVRHYVDTISTAEQVSCVLDSERRLLNARYHTTSHLLANIIESIYPDLKATKGHSFPNEGYVEFQGSMAPNVSLIVDALNASIHQNIKTYSFETDVLTFEQQFYKLPYHIPENKAFRVIQIGNYPPVPCGGTHLAYTSEIGNVTIGKIKVKNDTTRVAYHVVL